MRPKPTHSCDDCGSVNRRQFVTTTAAVSLAGASLAGFPRQLLAAPSPKSAAEEAVKEFYTSLTDEQRKEMALPMDDARRTRINANWSITKMDVRLFSKPQQELIDRVLKGITSADGYDRFMKQMDDDAGGVKNYAVAVFGNPLKGPFEFELTGRHLTLRADGNTIPGPAFGGPLVYGHGETGNSEDNLFFYQTKRANEVFAALDGAQKKKALLAKAPGENAVQLRDPKEARPGIAGADLSEDQKQLVAEVLRDILKPYRQEDVDEVMAIIKETGGMDNMNLSFYQNGDVGGDKVWDVWRLEGPSLVCHFRGKPHVHAYINVSKKL